MSAAATFWPDGGINFPRGLEFIRVAFAVRSDKFSRVVEAEINWLEALRAADSSVAVGELRGVLLHGLRVALRDRSDVSETQFTQDALLRVLERFTSSPGAELLKLTSVVACGVAGGGSVLPATSVARL